ncbi:MAG: hypothetical protein ACRCSQ_06755 [Bacteroidales bacterium]
MYNIQGKCIFSKNRISGPFEIKCHPGVYFVKTNQINQKIIVH